MPRRSILTAPRLVWELVLKPLSGVGRAMAGLMAFFTVVLPALEPSLGWPWSVSLFLLFLLCLSWVTLHRARRPGPQANVTWDEGKPEYVSRLCVENTGETATFSAKMELLEIRGLGTWRRSEHPIFYKPAWNETSEAEVRILKGDFRYLLLSRMDPLTSEEGLRGAKFGFYRLTRGGIEWTADHGWSLGAAADKWPVFVVRVSLLSEPPSEAPFEKEFEIECLRRGCRLRAVGS